jgi:hypothetical protein
MAEPWYGPILNSLLGALVGAWVVYYFGVRQLVAQRRLGFVERQLTEFYAPLAGLRKQIRAKSELRLRISSAANGAWTDICNSYGGQLFHDHEAKFAPFKKIIDYENDQLKNELIPMYRQMLVLFTERYHLADAETRAYYEEFLEFVELWNRWLNESLPAEVVERLDHREDKVKPFYDHVAARVAALQEQIAKGKAG